MKSVICESPIQRRFKRNSMYDIADLQSVHICQNLLASIGELISSEAYHYNASVHLEPFLKWNQFSISFPIANLIIERTGLSRPSNTAHNSRAILRFMQALHIQSNTSLPCSKITVSTQLNSGSILAHE